MPGWVELGFCREGGKGRGIYEQLFFLLVEVLRVCWLGRVGGARNRCGEWI